MRARPPHEEGGSNRSTMFMCKSILGKIRNNGKRRRVDEKEIGCGGGGGGAEIQYRGTARRLARSEMISWQSHKTGVNGPARESQEGRVSGGNWPWLILEEELTVRLQRLQLCDCIQADVLRTCLRI